MSYTEKRSGEAQGRGQIVVVTGSSHSGKSSLIRELMSRYPGHTAHVAIDEVIEQIEIEQDDRWEHGLDLAYEEASSRAKALAEEGALVFFESTFTYVPPDDRPPELHISVLDRLFKFAEEAQVDIVLVQLTTDLNEVLRRRNQSDRLAEHIVRTIWHQHAAGRLSAPRLLSVDTTRLSTAEAADELCDSLFG